MIGYQFNFDAIPELPNNAELANALVAFIFAYQKEFGGVHQEAYDALPEFCKAYWAAFEIKPEVKSKNPTGADSGDGRGGERSGMSRSYTARDFKNNIETMEKEGLPLTAPVEVYIGNKIYHITRLGHFHVIPNMTVRLNMKVKEL